MIHGVVVTHGRVAAELVAVVESILGPGQGLSALSNQGKGAPELTAAVKAACAEAVADDARGVLLFVDDMAGSCAVACRLAAGVTAQARVLSGVNLAMLLDFCTWRDSLSSEELARRLVEKGRQAIAILPANPGDDD
ncbi:MAG TPA: hypothetical protein P5571_03315 [Candidatus Krumholzibacteria bacterium]|nr:hypothetical protein [Candidatus Krumholzibacteria bacterium]HRX50372.1 hypothetical protein [Candidatus Krumholzibacteria bacterium]